MQDRLAANARAVSGYRPLFYNLADEPGIADLAANWDFDLSPMSLAGMRKWLANEYGSLAALNAEWGSHFPVWNEVVPETTDEAMRGPHDNFAAWADFKAWMDVAFARAIAAGTAALHAADPHARSAIEGGQIPGTGGWNYGRLAGTVDVMEVYRFRRQCRTRALACPEDGAADDLVCKRAERAASRLARAAARHARARALGRQAGFCLHDGMPGPRARDAMPYYAEMRGGLGALLIASERQIDPIAILYSQASLRVQWMLEPAAGRRGLDRAQLGR